VVATRAEQPFAVTNIPVSSSSFAIRICLATILALFASFWLQLELRRQLRLPLKFLPNRPRGQALDKAVFRLIATVVGVNRNRRPLLAGEGSDPGGV
jgi:hypothetical protein